MTLLSAALTSPARLRLAIEWRLQIWQTLLHEHDVMLSLVEKMALLPLRVTVSRLASFDTLLAAEAEINKFELDSFTLAGAAASGDVQKMIRLHTEAGCVLGSSRSYVPADALSWAARGGSVEAMRWLRQQGCQYKTRIFENAAFNGHLNVLRFLHDDGYTVLDVTGADLIAPCECAARRGHLEVLRWLHEHGWPWGNACQQAAYGDSVPVMMYLRDQGFTFNEQTMVDAVAGGPSVCEYLRTVECPWDTCACAAAVRWGCIDSLRWLHVNGCPWDAQAVNTAAAKSDSIEVIQYVWQQNGSPTAAVLSEMLKSAIELDNNDLADWLR
jgi:hypothetical protein